MAYQFTKLWGPSERQATRYKITWTFYAILANGTGQRYRLVFDGEKRAFITKRITTKDDGHKAAAYADAMSLGDEKAQAVGKTVTEILRARLSADDLAKATALAMTFQR